jgi:hypothetical protein
MTEDPMKAERDFYDEADLDFSKMRRVPLRRTGGSVPLSTFAVRLEGEAIDHLRRLAAERGLGPTQLARAWILERLAAERGSTREPLSPERAMSETLKPLVRAAVAEELADRMVVGLTREGVADLLAALESAAIARRVKTPATKKPVKKAAPTKRSASR